MKGTAKNEGTVSPHPALSQRLSVTREKSPPILLGDRQNHCMLLCPWSSPKLSSYKAFWIPFSLHGSVWWEPTNHFQKQDLCKISAFKCSCPKGQLNNRTIAHSDNSSGERPSVEKHCRKWLEIAKAEGARSPALPQSAFRWVCRRDYLHALEEKVLGATGYGEASHLRRSLKARDHLTETRDPISNSRMC